MTPAEQLKAMLELRRAFTGTPLDAAAQKAHERLVARLKREARP